MRKTILIMLAIAGLVSAAVMANFLAIPIMIPATPTGSAGIASTPGAIASTPAPAARPIASTSAARPATMAPAASTPGARPAGATLQDPPISRVLESLHVRSCAGIDCAIVGYLEPGDQITVTGKCSAGWLEIASTPAGIASTPAPEWVRAVYLFPDPCEAPR